MPVFCPRSRADREAGSAGHAARRSGPAAAFLLPFLLASIALAVPAGPARAQQVRTWMPPDLDSLRTWSTEARRLFQANTGDSATGDNFRAYERVGRSARKLLRSLGRPNLIQAPAIKSVLDSLGLETDVRVDPVVPEFVLVMVRNPYKRTAAAVGYLYWYKGSDLRAQPVTFAGGDAPQMRVWWTGVESGPYSWGIVERTRGVQRHHLTVLSLTPTGDYWRITQYDPNSLDLGVGASVTWADLNGDQRPELVAWVPAVFDSMVQSCPDCPRPVNEMTYVQGARGFELLDVRIVPSPITTFTMFVRMLAQGERSNASRLLADPKRIQEAVSLGWAGPQPKGAWRILYTEPNTAWPRWLMVRHQGSTATHDWRVLLEPVRGRWLISRWENRDDASTPKSSKPAGTKPPATGKPTGTGTGRSTKR
jgi:hypothetical protein